MWLAIKKWLKKSGTYHYDAAPDFWASDEIIDSLNPLEPVIEDPDCPWAKIYRESFWIGINDTYHVLLGNHYDRGLARKGVIDILLFPIISRRLYTLILKMRFIGTNNYFFLFILAITKCICYLIAGALELVRGLLGITVTLALTPIVAIVHIIAFFKKMQLTRQILQLPIKKIGDDNRLCDNGKMRKSCLHDNSWFSIIAIPVFEQSKDSDNEEKNADVIPQSILEVARSRRSWYPSTPRHEFKDKSKQSITRYVLGFFDEFSRREFFIDPTPENAGGIKALLSINHHRIVNSLKDQGVFDNIMDQLISSRSVREAFVQGMSKSSRNQSSTKRFCENPLYDPNLPSLIFAHAGCATKKQAAVVNMSQSEAPTTAETVTHSLSPPR